MKAWLRRYIQNREVPGSNPTRCSVGLWDPTLLQGRLTLTVMINIGLARPPLDSSPKVGPGIAKKKKRQEAMSKNVTYTR